MSTMNSRIAKETWWAERVQRMERGNVYINIARAEAVLLAKEQIPGEVYRQGERLRS